LQLTRRCSGSRDASSAKPVIGTVLIALLLNGCQGVSSMLGPAGPEAARIAFGWWLMFGISVFVLALVVVMLLTGLFRKRRSGETDPAGTARQSAIMKRNERRWHRFVIYAGMVAPAVILGSVMGINLFSERVIAAAAQRPALEVEIIAHQWWWEIRYPGQGVVTANELHIPTGQRVKLSLSSTDVKHSFWVPQLEGKRDLIPGQTNILTFEAAQEGIYRGQCAEFCGRQHAKMAFLVIAEPAAAFELWIRQQQQPAAAPATELARAGQQVFLRSACIGCHTVAGTTAAGTVGPDLTHIASRFTLAAATLPNTPAQRAGWIVNSQALKPGNDMPVMELAPADLHALLAWLETLE
jgi:cytochrome c oxidase subunit 2